MQPRQYLDLLKRWGWVLALGLVIGVAAGWIFSIATSPVYQATSKVLVMRAPESNSSSVASQTDTQLTQTFTELLLTRPVLDATSDKLGFHVSASQIRLQRVTNAQLIQVVVEDEDPNQAAEIANTVVDTSLEQYEKLQSSRFATSEGSLQAQIQQVEQQITDIQAQLSQTSVQTQEDRVKTVTDIIANLQTEITALQEEIIRLQYSSEPYLSADLQGRAILVTPTPSVDQRIDLTRKQERLDELQGLLDIYQQIYVDLSYTTGSGISGNLAQTSQLQSALVLYQQIYANLLSNLESIRLANLQSTPNVVMVENAVAPTRPIRPRTSTNILLGGVIGLLLAGGIAFLVEYLDDTIRDVETITDLLQMPVLGTIGDMGNRENHIYPPYVLEEPRSPITEAFRSLRTNLEFTALDKPLHSLLLTSARGTEGKTTLAVNLAVIIAQAGKKVVLIDADLRKPSVHEKLELPNRFGLSDALREHLPLADITHYLRNENLSVITSGGLPPNPAEVLGSERMAQLLQELKQIYDIIIIDGPPSLLADATVLSSRVDGVLIILEARGTQQSAAVQMVEQLDRAGARVIGAALNRIRDRGISPYYRNLEGYSYFKSGNSEKAPEEATED